MAQLSPILNVLVAAAKKAGRSLIRDFGEVEHLQVSKKGTADFVSRADLRAEEILKRELSKSRPGYGLLMEESGETAGEPGQPRFIVDPLDGTTNFLHGIPMFAVSIGVETDGEPTAGVIYNPAMDELFYAERGNGAYLMTARRDERLRVSARRKDEELLIATGIPFKDRGDHAHYLDRLGRVMAQTAGIRRFGSAALDLAWTAAGRYDGFFEFGLSPWDVTAGIVILREAGGLVSDLSGQGRPHLSGSLLAANEGAHASLARMLSGAGGKR